jgi:predicted outer membrane repeat protein
LPFIYDQDDIISPFWFLVAWEVEMKTAKRTLLLVICACFGVSVTLSILGWAGLQSRVSAAALQSPASVGDFDFGSPGHFISSSELPEMSAPGIPPSGLAIERDDATPLMLPEITALPAVVETPLAPSTPGSLFTVVNTNNSGAGSLRDAVTQANALAGPDEIRFSLSGCPCVITLLSELPTSGALTITGPGANLLTLSGNNTNRIFSTTAGNPLYLSGLTLANGYNPSQGGGAIASGNLTLQNITIKDSTATFGGGAYVDGTLVLTDTIIQNNAATTSSGGGIYVSGVLSARAATFRNNTAFSDGGGAYINNNVTITGGSFENNRTTQVKSYGGGGGLFAFGTSAISGVQFLDNNTPSWGGGAYLANFAAGTTNRLANLAFTNNSSAYGGGGLFQWFSAAITSTQFLNNQSATLGGGLYAGYAGSYTIRLHGGVIQGNSAPNGGGLYSDGSFTLQGTSVYSNTATNGRGGGALSLARASVANSTFAYNTVTTGGNGAGLVAEVGAAITDTTFLRNRVFGAGSGGGLMVGTNQNGGDANLLRLTFTQNSSDQGYGGGLLSYGTTRLVDSNFSSNTSWNDGGGAWVRGPLTLTGGLFQGNRTLLNENNGGGGGLMSMGYASISATHFVANTTADWGGGAYIYSPSVKSASLINGAEFTNNTATSGGGGGLFTWFTATLTAPTFTGNYAGYRGGGLYAGYAGDWEPQVIGGAFSGNSAVGGGGLFSDAEVRLAGVQFHTNTARSGFGGGVWTVKSARVVDGLFHGNLVLSNGNGGGLEASNTIWLTDTVFSDNHNLTGSGGGSSNGGDIHILRGEYRSNQAADDGGGVLAYGTATINGTRFYTNTTGDLGGGVGVSYLVARNNLFQGNSAGNAGGGAFANISLNLQDASLVGNHATTSGGGIFTPQATIQRSSFNLNTAGSRGGGLFLSGGSNSLDRLSFIANQATAGGGLSLEGAAGGSLVNSLLAGNTAIGGSGAALYLSTSGALTIRHATIASPSLVPASAFYLNDGSITVENTIIARHATGLVRVSGSAVLQNPLFYANTTNTLGAGITVNGAVSGDPAFFNPVVSDYHLAVGSQAFNAGVNVGVTSDFDGDARPQGGQPDIGYDEAVTPSGVNFTHNAPHPAAQPVTFIGSVAFGQGVTFSWSFGDGDTAQGQTVTHTYAQPGVYTVMLTAANAAGQNLVTKNVTITNFELYLPMLVR